MLKSIQDLISEGDLSKIVDYVIDQNRKKTQIENDLSAAKVYLRAEAKKRGQRASVDLNGLSGTITVTFPGLTVKTKKGKDLRDLELSLPPEVFSQLFHRTVVIVPAMPADDFLEVLAGFNPAHRNTVRLFLEEEEQTPKVFVPR